MRQPQPRTADVPKLMESRNSNRFSRADQSERRDELDPARNGRHAPFSCPLAGAHDEDSADAPYAYLADGPRTRRRLFRDAAILAERLPDAAGVVNLCEDRYAFSLTLLAAAIRGQTCLLPPSLQAGILREILEAHPRSYLACDREVAAGAGEAFRVIPPDGLGWTGLPFPAFESAEVVAFTSGSTGRPKACRHRFETFAASARMALASLGLGDEVAMVVSTTPPQHMFGLETSIFWPLFSGLALHTGRPFFPEDIRRAVLSSSRPCLLATTPAHLSAVVRTGGAWRNVRAIICSTSRLAPELARQAEALLGAPVIELYGSTETLSLASRRTAHESLWRPYRGVALYPERDGKTRLSAPHLFESVRLDDSLSLEADGRFLLAGRAEDMIKIGGKRGSLAELNQRLTALAGVRDGVFHCYEDARGHTRLAAVVVGEADGPGIVDGLRSYLDELFIPKRIHHVREIPRNETGKLIRDDWQALLSTLGYQAP